METITGKTLQDASLSEVIGIIVAEHHDYFKYNLPIISTILNSTMEFEKDAVKNLDLISKLYLEFKELLEQHIAKEKFILFPLLQKMNLDKESDFKGNELRKTYHKIWNEITQLSAYLKKINRLSNNYKPAEDASQ